MSNHEYIRDLEAERDQAVRDVSDMSTGAWGSSAAMIVALKHRAEAAEAQLADIRRQMEEARADGNWPLADVVAERDQLSARVEQLEAALLHAEHYCARPPGICFPRQPRRT